MRTFLDRMVFMRGLGLRLGWQKNGTGTPAPPLTGNLELEGDASGNLDLEGDAAPGTLELEGA